MVKKVETLSGAVVRKKGADLDDTRYQYLALNQAEPNPGDPESDGSLFSSNADGTRSWTTSPTLSGLSFNPFSLDSASDNFALFIKNNPINGQIDSVGYRRLGELAFLDSNLLTLEQVTLTGNTTTRGIKITGYAGLSPDSGALAVTSGGISLTGGSKTLRIDSASAAGGGTVYITGLPELSNGGNSGYYGLLSLSNDSVAKRQLGTLAYKDSDFVTLQQVTTNGRTTTTPVELYGGFSLTTSNLGTEGDYRSALIVKNNGTEDSVGFRSLSDLALYDSTNNIITLGQLKILDVSTSTYNKVLIHNDSTNNIEFRLLPESIFTGEADTLQSVVGRGNELNLYEMVINSALKLPTLDSSQDTLTGLFLGATDSVVARTLTIYAVDSTTINLQSVTDNNDSTTNTITVGGIVAPYLLPTTTSNKVLILDSSGRFDYRTMAENLFDGEDDTLTSVVARGDSTNLSLNLQGGITLYAAETPAQPTYKFLNVVAGDVVEYKLVDSTSLLPAATFTLDQVASYGDSTNQKITLTSGLRLISNAAITGSGPGTGLKTIQGELTALALHEDSVVLTELQSTVYKPLNEFTLDFITNNPMGYSTDNQLRIGALSIINPLNFDSDGSVHNNEKRSLFWNGIDSVGYRTVGDLAFLDSDGDTLSVITGRGATTTDSVSLAGLNLTAIQPAANNNLNTLLWDATTKAVSWRELDSTAFTGELDTLASVTARGATTTDSVTLARLYLTAIDSTQENNVLVWNSGTNQVSYRVFGSPNFGAETLSSVIQRDSSSIYGVNISNIYINDGAITSTKQLFVDNARNVTANDVTVLGNLQVTGTTTTINSVQLNVKDKSLVIADSATTSSEADSAGIYLGSSNSPIASIRYNHPTTSWDLSNTLRLLTTANQSSEQTTLVIDGNNVVGTRELGTLAFLDSEGNTLQDVTDLGATTTNLITINRDGEMIVLGSSSSTDKWIQIQDVGTGVRFGLNDALEGGNGGSIIQVGLAKIFGIVTNNNSNFDTLTNADLSFYIGEDGNTNVNSSLNVNSVATIHSNLVVDSDVTFYGALSVDGVSNLDSATVDGDLKLTGQLLDNTNRTLIIYDSAGTILWGN